LVRGGAVLIGGGGERIRLLLPAAVPWAASAVLDASSKVVATKIENVDFMGLPPFCVDQSIETRGECSALRKPGDQMSHPLVALSEAAATIHYKRATLRNIPATPAL